MAKKPVWLRGMARAALLVSIVSATAHADVSVGDRIGPDNVDKVKDLVSPGMEWCIKRGWPMTISETKKIEWPQAYKEATEKFSGQVKLTNNGADLANYVAGLPFPNVDAKDPQAALKIMWNYTYGFVTTDDLDIRNFDADTGTIADKGAMTVERHFLLDHLRRLFWTGRLYVEPKPEKPNPNGYRSQEGLVPHFGAVRLEGRRRIGQSLYLVGEAG